MPSDEASKNGGRIPSYVKATPRLHSGCARLARLRASETCPAAVCCACRTYDFTRSDIPLRLPMPSRSLIVLSFDALATSPLGPYGCSWLETPGLCRLSASSIVFDRVIAASLSPLAVLEGFMRDMRSGASVAASASSSGASSLFFTDSQAAADLSAAGGFDETVLVEEGSEGLETGDAVAPAREIEETQYARLLAAALARRESLGPTPHLLWIHSSSLTRHWDAPHALRDADDAYQDDEEFSAADPQVAAEIDAARQSVVPPHLHLDDDTDPDFVLAWMSAYGAQIRAVDALIDVVLDTIETGTSEDGVATDLVLASTSGFALGEHRWIGTAAGPPRSPRIQLPLMIRQHSSEPLRSLHLASSSRLAATLIELITGAEPQGGEPSLLRDTTSDRWATPPESLEPVCETDGGELAPGAVMKTTPEWFYVRDVEGDEHLYLKPDDRNDANDIASRESDVVEALRE